MADDLDQGYMQTRQTMRDWQNRMLFMEPTQDGADVRMGVGVGVKPDAEKPAPSPQPQAPVTLAPDATLPPEQPQAQPPNTITVDTPEVAAVRQQFKEQTKPYVFALDTFDVPGDVVRAGLAKLSGVDRGTNEGNLRMSSDEMVNRVFFQYGEKPEEVIKKAEELGLPEAQTLKIMSGLAAVVLGMATDPLNVTPGGKAKDAGKIAKATDGIWTHSTATPLGQLEKRPMYFDKGGEWNGMGDKKTLSAKLDIQRPLVESEMKPGEYERIAQAFKEAGGTEQEVADFLKYAKADSGDQWFHIPPALSTALENLGYDGIVVDRSMKGTWAIALDPPKQVALHDEKTSILSEFKRAAQILKSERGSVPLGGGGAGKPPDVPPVNIGGAAEEPISPKALATISRREQAKADFTIKVEGFKDEITKQRRGPVLSDEAVRKLAGDSGFTLQDLLDLKPGSILAPEIQVAARDVFKASAAKMKASAKAYLERADPQAFDEFAQAFAEASTATTRIIGTFAEGGRTFRLFNQKYPTLKTGVKPDGKDPEFSIQDQYIQEMYKFFRSVEEKSKMGGFDQARTGPGMGPGGMVSPGQLAQMVVDLPSEEAMMAFAKAALKPTWGDMFYEIWVNGLLSGPITHSTNIISNAATLLWNIPERQVASLIKPGSVRPGEAAAMVGGVLESVGDAWRLAWKAFKEDAPQFGQSKLETPKRAITADALELTGATGAAVDFLGNAVRLPGRFLMAGDDFFKSIAFRAELRALAKRQAFREINELGLTGKEAARKAKEIEGKILADPPESIKEAAQEFAAYTTFTRELGTAGSAMQMAVQNVPFGRVVLPFIRTPANIFKFAGERTPFALASKAVREELAAGGERQALALAKIGLGSMTMGYMASLAASGYITGGGPKDKVLRKQLELEGWQPYSFKIGKEYVSFARIEPLGSLIGMAADAADLMGQLGEKDSAELASALTVAISRNVANKTFVKGLAGTLNAVTSQDVHVVKSFLEKELPTLMPYSSAIGQTAKVVDPVMRDVQSILDAFKAKVPGFSDDLPPMRNLWGEKILLQGGLGPDLVSPLYVREIKDDKVAQELNRLKYPFTLPSRKIDGIDLPPTVYDRYSEIAGSAKLLGNMNLHDKMQQTINSSLYKMAADGPDGGRVTLLREDIRIFRDLAAIELEKENKDFAQARQLQRMRAATKFDANARQKQGAAPTLR